MAESGSSGEAHSSCNCIQGGLECAALVRLVGSYLAAFQTNDSVFMGDYSGIAAYDGRVYGV